MDDEAAQKRCKLCSVTPNLYPQGLMHCKLKASPGRCLQGIGPGCGAAILARSSIVRWTSTSTSLCQSSAQGPSKLSSVRLFAAIIQQDRIQEQIQDSKPISITQCSPVIFLSSTSPSYGGSVMNTAPSHGEFRGPPYGKPSSGPRIFPDDLSHRKVYAPIQQAHRWQHLVLYWRPH